MVLAAISATAPVVGWHLVGDAVDNGIKADNQTRLAIDVFVPGVAPFALLYPAALIATVLAESTSVGVRSHRAERTVLARRFEEVTTPWGKVRIKLGLQSGAVINAAPEFDDCRTLADAAKIPVKQVLAAAVAAWESRRR